MTEHEADVLIACTQLTQVYRVGSSEVIALQGLDLDVGIGEMVGVVGASGSGKSTLMSVLSAMLKPTGGQVVIGGLDLGAARNSEVDRYRRETIGIVLQDAASNLLPYLTAEQNVSLPLELNGDPEAAVRAHELLELVDLADRAGHHAHELSGGEQQRVALAMALAHKPKILLADEPTGALDSANTEAMFALMGRVGSETGLTQVIVSHDPELARHVDRVVSIRDGRVAAEQRWVGAGEQVDEVLVVDSIGRLQLTDEQLAVLGDQRRVRAEIADNTIEIRRADDE